MRQVVLASLLVSLALPAIAENASSNLPPDFYPQPKCEKPDKNAIGKAPGLQKVHAAVAAANQP